MPKAFFCVTIQLVKINMHNYLRKKLSWYRRWHEQWIHGPAHWVVFACTVLTATSLFSYILHSAPGQAIVANFVPSAQAQASGTTYYVDNKEGSNCGDTGPGSLAQPYCTIHKAVSVTLPGDTVYIRSGTYFELSGTMLGSGDRGTLNITRAGSPGNPITYKGYPGDTMPNITGNATTYAVVIGASDITIDSLDVSGGYRGVTLIGTENITIRNSNIHHLAGRTGGNNNAGIIGGVFGGVQYGMFQNILIENNEIHDNKDATCFSGTGGGIEFYGLDNSIIRNNHIYNEWGGIWLKSHNSNMKVYNNIVHDVDEGIYFYGEPMNIQVYNNIVYNYSATGLGARMSSSTYPPDQNMSFYNNVVIGDGGSTNKHTFYQVVSNGTKVFNNIFYYGNRGGCVAGNESGELMNRPGYSVTNFSEGNNVFYHPTDNKHFCWNGTRYTLATWLTYWDGAGGNPANGAGSLESDPLFVSTDPVNPNFLQLSATSPAIDAGTVIAGIHCPVSDDSNPNQTNCVHWKGAAPDIGVYEYGVTVLDTTPPAAVTNLRAL